jgi:hypothetical protein
VGAVLDQQVPARFAEGLIAPIETKVLDEVDITRDEGLRFRVILFAKSSVSLQQS